MLTRPRARVPAVLSRDNPSIPVRWRIRRTGSLSRCLSSGECAAKFNSPEVSRLAARAMRAVCGTAPCCTSRVGDAATWLASSAARGPDDACGYPEAGECTPIDAHPGLTALTDGELQQDYRALASPDRYWPRQQRCPRRGGTHECLRVRASSAGRARADYVITQALFTIAARLRLARCGAVGDYGATFSGTLWLPWPGNSRRPACLIGLVVPAESGCKRFGEKSERTISREAGLNWTAGAAHSGSRLTGTVSVEILSLYRALAGWAWPDRRVGRT